MQSVPIEASWEERNQASLLRAIGRVRAAVKRHLAKKRKDPTGAPNPGQEPEPASAPEPAEEHGFQSALGSMVQLFQLSPFERDVLVLAAGVELDGELGALCAEAHGDPRRMVATFGLALSALPNPHWSALSPSAPLRKWKLVEVDGPSPTQNTLRVDERILHGLAGIDHLDSRLTGLAEFANLQTELPPSHEQLKERLIAAWDDVPRGERRPVIELLGPDAASKREIVAALGRDLRLAVLRVSVGRLLTLDDPEVAKLVTRECALTSALCFLDGDDVEGVDPTRVAALLRLVESLDGLVVWSCRERRALSLRATLAFEVERPTHVEQAALWKAGILRALGDVMPEDLPTWERVAEELSGQFSVSVTVLDRILREARSASKVGGQLDLALWDACRRQSRPRLDELAQRIETNAGWDDLVLPEAQMRLLREITLHVKARARVYGSWGFGSKSARGLGITAVFAGPSGTGKTLAAEIIAKEIHLDLHRIDLSQVVSKYIGETERNLRRVFDAAEEGGSVLLFDEADALFGKRSEVQDSHDRYANIEVSYLLQRMESYRGLAILTTNMKNALDPAFARRIRFMVDMRFPGPDERRRIWERMFPSKTPQVGLNFVDLSRLNVAGGNIRNIALYAAFLAAAENSAVNMRHVYRAAQVEYQKLERPLTEISPP